MKGKKTISAGIKNPNKKQVYTEECQRESSKQYRDNRHTDTEKYT